MCNHQFLEIEKTTKSALPKAESHVTAPIANRYREWQGVRAGCINCGEIRVLWENGEVQVELTGHDAIS